MTYAANSSSVQICGSTLAAELVAPGVGDSESSRHSTVILTPPMLYHARNPYLSRCTVAGIGDPFSLLFVGCPFRPRDGYLPFTDLAQSPRLDIRLSVTKRATQATSVASTHSTLPEEAKDVQAPDYERLQSPSNTFVLLYQLFLLSLCQCRSRRNGGGREGVDHVSVVWRLSSISLGSLLPPTQQAHCLIRRSPGKDVKSLTAVFTREYLLLLSRKTSIASSSIPLVNAVSASKRIFY